VIYSFGDFALDEARFELRCGGRAVEIQPKALELLLHLVRQRGRVVSKREILDAVWPGVRVTEGSLGRAVSLVRAALADRGAKPALVVTVPWRGYRFEAEVRESESLPAAPGLAAANDGASRYVGRAALIARLEERLDAALAGSGRILLLAGEAGIGKTRTAELLASRARRAGARVVAGIGPPDPAGTPAGWAQLLRSLAASVPGVVAELQPGSRAALARVVPEIDSDLEPRLERARSEEAERFAFFHSVRSFLLAAARSRPLALFLEDLHAAEAASIALLEFVGQSIGDQPVAIVVTCREDDAASTPRQARAIEHLLRLTGLERWPLFGLDAAEIREFVRSRTAHDGGDGLIAALERQTSGNPLLMGEGLRSLEARGLLRVERSAREWEALLPPGVRHLLLPKLRQLSAAASAALGHAAALGSEVEPEVLARCVADGAPLDACLSELFAAALLLPPSGPGRGPRFRHALVREALYEELVPAGEWRRGVHARISEALEERGLDTEAALFERARHACEGAPLVPPERAAALARRAAERAARLFDFEGAVGWTQRALALTAPGERALRAALLLDLGAAQTRALGHEPARASYREAAEHARALGRADLLAAAALGFAHRPSSSGLGDAESIELLEEARRASLEGDDALRIRVLSRLAVELRYAETARAEALVTEAVAAARRSCDPQALAQALDDSTFVRWSPEDGEGWIALNAEVVRAAQACGDLELALSGQRGVVTGRLELGDPAGVERGIRACERTADALRTPQARWFCTALRAMDLLRCGDLGAAERKVGESIGLAERLDTSEIALEVGSQLVYLRLEQGRAAEVADAVRAQVERFPETPAWRAALARVLAAAGRLAEARLALEPLAARGFADVPRDRGHLPTLAIAAEVAAALGDEGAAAALEARLAPHARLHVVVGSGLLYYGTVAHALALCAATRSRWDDAIAHFSAALALHEKAGAALWAARTRIAWARALLARGATGDAVRAVRLARRALRSAYERGWSELATSGRDLEAALWRKRPSPGRFALGSERS
jgi:DNA-binding winged helix-turn-helix (wHTH) protein/tetratricopeptide (TPR) repeat protein